jgi:SprT protein
MLSSTQQQHIVKRVNEIVTLASQKFNKPIDPIRTVFKKRGRAAGTANFSRREVNFNAILAAENFDDFEDTIGHEVAHIVAYDVYGRQAWNHGPLWKSTMVTLGYSPDRCHSYDTTNSRREVTQYVWSCKCKEFIIGPKRHQKLIATKGMAYRCNTCGGHLSNYVRVHQSVQFPVEQQPKIKENDQTAGETKQQKVVNLVRKNGGSLTTKQMIALIMREVGMTEAGARTYFYNARKSI